MDLSGVVFVRGWVQCPLYQECKSKVTGAPHANMDDSNVRPVIIMMQEHNEYSKHSESFEIFLSLHFGRICRIMII